MFPKNTPQKSTYNLKGICPPWLHQGNKWKRAISALIYQLFNYIVRFVSQHQLKVTHMYQQTSLRYMNNIYLIPFKALLQLRGNIFLQLAKQRRKFQVVNYKRNSSFITPTLQNNCIAGHTTTWFCLKSFRNNLFYLNLFSKLQQKKILCKTEP